MIKHPNSHQKHREQQPAPYNNASHILRKRESQENGNSSTPVFLSFRSIDKLCPEGTSNYARDMATVLMLFPKQRGGKPHHEASR